MRNPSRRSPRTILTLLLWPLAASCESRGALGDDLAVQPIAPVNGAAPSKTASAGGTRPVFRWTATPAATRFELQVDDSCTSTTACTFPSPEIDEKTLHVSSYSPPMPLAVGTSKPIARRYYWHVRACQDETCGNWSPVRSILVGVSTGRLNTDLNGDGFEDAVVSAPTSRAGGQGAGSFSVYLGGARPSATPALVVNHDRAEESLGYGLAMLGDVNGDGFGDYVVRSQGDESTPGVAPTPHAYVYFGGETLSAQPDVVLDAPSVDDENGAVAGIGDVNGDGYDDFAIGGMNVDSEHKAETPSRVEVHFGGPALANAPDLTLRGEPGGPIPDFFGSSVAGIGDLNADGFADFAVGAAGGEKVRLYFGGPGLDVIADVTLVGPPEAGGYQHLFGFGVAGIGDFNGDGVDDLAVGAPASTARPGPLGAVHVYFGGTTLHATPDVSFVGRHVTDWFGKVVVGPGDLDGDGFDDLAVMTPGVAGPFPDLNPPPAENNLRVDFFRGAAAPDTTPAFSFATGPASAYRRGLAARDLDGDGRPDLLVGRWDHAPSATFANGGGRVDVLVGIHSYTSAALTWSSGSNEDEFGAVIGR